MRPFWRDVAIGSAIVCGLTAGYAQGPVFDAISVKPSAGGRSLLPTVKGRQLTAINFPLRPIIRMAYGRLVDGTLQQLQDNQLLGGPDWIDTDRFDIVAGLPEGPRAPGELQRMIRALLADRFGLRAHAETRDLPVYALVVARADRGPGPGLKRSSAECGAPAAN